MKTQRQNLFKLGKILILLLLSTFYGCKNNNDELQPAISGAEVPVEINLQSASFEDAGAVKPRALSANLMGSASSQETQIQQIKLNNNIDLVAEMVPVTDTAMPQKRASANSIPTAVPLQTRYTVLVFQTEANGGKFVKAQNYEVGAEQFRDPMMLNPGTYQFVTISSNKRTGAHPSYTFTSQDSTLTHCRAAVSAVDDDDFMHEVQQKTITGNGNNTLNILLHHDATLVTVTLDSSPLGKQITAVNGAYLETSNSILNINLKDGSYDYNGSRLNRDLFVTPALPATSVSSNVLIYPPNSIGFAPKVVIPRLGIGQDQPFTNITIEGFELKPGFRYQLKITLKASGEVDIYGRYMGYPVARINGRIWMRHNLGADYTVDPGGNSINTKFDLWGDFYSWGYEFPFKKRQSTSGNVINTLRPFQDYWDSTWQTNLPTKNTRYDPCPAGFRVPTAKEVEGLIAGTVATKQGTWLTTIDHSWAYLSLTSKTNTAVKLWIPATGYWSDETKSLLGPNVYLFLWTATTNISSPGRGYAFEFNTGNGAMPYVNSVYKSHSFQIRCIVESTDKKINLLPAL